MEVSNYRTFLGDILKVLYIYNPQIEYLMEAVQDHETEVKELFDKLTAAVPGSTTVRAISLEAFTVAISIMMNKAYYHGQVNAIETTEEIMSKVFTH